MRLIDLTLEANKYTCTGEDVVLAETDILTMSTEARAKAAASLKAKGNTAYQARSFETAAEFYTRAIAVSPKAEPVFYSNRAACSSSHSNSSRIRVAVSNYVNCSGYVNMSPPQHDLVVRDCDIALQLDKTYIKALNRRAAAHEGLNQLQEALRDYTAATILDKFQNESTAQAVERVLKKLAQQTAEDMLKAREPRLPSYTFVSAYFAAFRARPKPTLPSEEEGQLQGDNTLMMGLDALAAADYVHAFTLINESLDQGVSTDKLRAVALNQRGTFKFLVGDVAGAKADLEASLALDRSLTQTWVKIASVHMERGDPQAAFAAFNEAIMQDENDADIYYHRGQVLFIMNEFAEAAENYTKSTELDGNFVFSQIQLAVAQYKGEMLGKAMATFRATLRNFPNRSEPQNYYGELLLDQGRFEEAVEKFEKAVELEKAKYVMLLLIIS
jgi:import receptor subunit TOM70